MKLRSKRGWIFLEFEEVNGDSTILMPKLDPYIRKAQLTKIEFRPDDLLTYAGRLKQIFEEAERPLKSIQYIQLFFLAKLTECSVHSCFSLNSNPSRQLYFSSANLIDYIGLIHFLINLTQFQRSI